MGKRKVYVKTDLTTVTVEYRHDSGKVVILPEAMPPSQTVVFFPANFRNRANFDFAPWYGLNIDELTYACQRQIERFVDKQDSDVSIATVLSYCSNGLNHFLNYASMLAQALSRSILLDDINRSMIDGFLRFLRDRATHGVTTQRTFYNYVKAVLVALGRRGLVRIVDRSDDATFPSNPFPDSHRLESGEKPLSLKERKEFTVAVKAAVLPLFHKDANAPSLKMLTSAYLVVALHTGRNTVPLLEMTTDALRPHPKDATEFLVLYKRRGHSSSKVVVRSALPTEQLAVESMPSVRLPVARLIRQVIDLTADLRADAPPEISNRVWLWRSDGGVVKALSISHLNSWTCKLVREHHLKDADGKPLRINVSRLRKTFINRINEILDGDLAATSVAAGNQVSTTDRHYLRAGDDATRKWRFMGMCLVEELLTTTLGATERTPVGRCSDTKAGEFAPKRGGSFCQNFLNCLRCRNYVVTGDDLWRLFSFYWRVLRERNRMGRRRWEQRFAYIPRLIERDVIEAGLARKVFDPKQVDDARERALHDPHPYWATESVLSGLESFE